jgi:hypothetical protein
MATTTIWARSRRATSRSEPSWIASGDTAAGVTDRSGLTNPTER